MSAVIIRFSSESPRGAKRRSSNAWPCGWLRRAIMSLAALLLCVAYPVSSTGEVPEASHIQFVGKNLFATANGTFHAWRVVGSHVLPDDLANSHVDVEVDLSSVDTGIERRDKHLRTADFFETETYPLAKIRVHSAVLGGTDEQGRERYAAKFDIDLHGVQKTLDGEFYLVSTSPLQAEGSLVVDRLDFGIGKPRSAWNPMSVTEEIPVSFRVSLP